HPVRLADVLEAEYAGRLRLVTASLHVGRPPPGLNELRDGAADATAHLAMMMTGAGITGFLRQLSCRFSSRMAADRLPIILILRKLIRRAWPDWSEQPNFGTIAFGESDRMAGFVPLPS